MGIFNTLFRKTLAPKTAARFAKEGLARLWRRDFGVARGFLDQAVDSGGPDSAVALAYRSLLRRMYMDVSGALEDADRAIEIKPDLFVAHAARTVALLTGEGRIPEAMASYDQSTKCVPHDAEAHFLRLILWLLFTEMIVNADEQEERVELQLRHTPVVRGAICLLDGYSELAVQEFSADSTAALARIGLGMSFYRLGRYDDARSTLRSVLDGCEGLPIDVRLSLEGLLADENP